MFKATLAGTARILDNRSLGHCHLGCHQDTISLTPAGPPNDNFKFKAPTDPTRQWPMAGNVVHSRPYDTSNPPVCILSRLAATTPVEEREKVKSVSSHLVNGRPRPRHGIVTAAGSKSVAGFQAVVLDGHDVGLCAMCHAWSHRRWHTPRDQSSTRCWRNVVNTDPARDVAQHATLHCIKPLKLGVCQGGALPCRITLRVLPSSQTVWRRSPIDREHI